MNIHDISLATLKRPNDDMYSNYDRPKNTFRINSSFILNDNPSNGHNSDNNIRLKALVDMDSYLTSKGISPIGKDNNNT